MKIKQQKQIKAFLIEEFGKDSGISLFNEQEKTLNALIESTKDKTKNQLKTLCQTILPRIALYKTLLSDDTHKENAYECMRKYTIRSIRVFGVRFKYSSLTLILIFASASSNARAWVFNGLFAII